MKIKNLIWTSNLAYAVGLFVADGHLSIDGRHLDFTSKDVEQVQTFKGILSLKATISKKSRSAEKEKKYYYVGFSDVGLYNFFYQHRNSTAKKQKYWQVRIA